MPAAHDISERTVSAPYVGTARRRFLGRMLGGGILAAGVLSLPACQSFGGFSLTEAVRRLMLLSSERAFTRLTAPDGYWDQAVSQLDLNGFLGARGDILGGILTSALFKSRLESAFADIAVDASYRAAPVVTEAVRTIGIANAVALINGQPSAATSYLRGEMAGSLVEAIVPDVAEALRVADDPLVGQALSALTGVNVAQVARSFAGEVDDVIWQQIGAEEAAIRADPASSRDPMLISVLGGAGALR
ncbi:DUF4197 domain-containing protein [Altericroceibacterium endophyticum]|uniref:DUF4197 family protein n=1 Tax=Altericroceibacterium endophyticum TaxID=1808508 RepID=A0A6I4SZN7_9SPHN|nr:DUF4197 domain-containing protein [Altericroceibacterium endophyticum]MXO64264.1 DUF4197 family protein [Altericroceibacterium endophyticum]